MVKIVKFYYCWKFQNCQKFLSVKIVRNDRIVKSAEGVNTWKLQRLHLAHLLYTNFWYFYNSFCLLLYISFSNSAMLPCFISFALSHRTHSISFHFAPNNNTSKRKRKSFTKNWFYSSQWNNLYTILCNCNYSIMIKIIKPITTSCGSCDKIPDNSDDRLRSCQTSQMPPQPDNIRSLHYRCASVSFVMILDLLFHKANQNQCEQIYSNDDHTGCLV